MSADRFARAAESAEELRVWAHGYSAGHSAAAETWRAAFTHLRDQYDASEAQNAGYRAAEAEWRADYDEDVRKGRGALPYLDVLHRRAEKHPESYAAEIARTQDHHDRVWSGWQTTPTTTRKAAA